jgi:hypothetical protein
MISETELTDVDVSHEKSHNICPHPSVISTDSPEVEVWNHIGQLTSLSYVYDFLKCQVKGTGEHPGCFP